MKLLIAVGLGLLAGFFVGVILSQLIGIAGMLIFQQPLGIKFLPVYTAVLGGLAAPFVAGRVRRQV